MTVECPALSGHLIKLYSQGSGSTEVRDWEECCLWTWGAITLINSTTMATYTRSGQQSGSTFQLAALTRLGKLTTTKRSRHKHDGAQGCTGGGCHGCKKLSQNKALCQKRALVIWMRTSPSGSCLNVWYPAEGTVLERSGSANLWKEVCHWGWVLSFQKHTLFPVHSLSAVYLRMRIMRSDPASAPHLPAAMLPTMTMD